MNILFVLLFFAFNCNAFNVKDIGNKISHLTSELGNTGENSLGTDETKVVSNGCPEKCNQELQELKKNMTDLYMAFLILRAEFVHLNQHMMFHERALKHIAVWGHKPSGGHNSDHNFRSDNLDINSHNQSSSNDQQNQESTHDLVYKKDNHNTHHNHRHRNPGHNSGHGHQHHNHNHNHNQQCNCQNPCNCENPYNPQISPDNKISGIREVVKEDNQKNLNKDNSEESSIEQSKPTKPSVIEKSDTNSSIPLNDSQNMNPSENGHKSGYHSHSHHSIDDHMNSKSLDTEFKRWFDDMLNDIYHKHNVLNDRTVGESVERLKVYNRLNPTKDKQKTVDEMETAFNSEDLIFATCAVRPNRHIALLNQQNIEGTINIWQLKHNRGPLNMHIKLKGFKVGNHEHSQSHSDQQTPNHNSANSRPVRESNLMPVEVEPNEPHNPIGQTHTHGFHVHEFGNLSRDCQSVGSHYNPLNLAHGGPYDVVRHVGDLGNIRCDKNGEIDMEFTYSQISLSGEHSIINRSLVIHNNPDDYGHNPNSPSSSTSGSTGVRIACCVIEEVKQLPTETDSQTSVGSVAAPVGVHTRITSKRRRDTSVPELMNRNHNRFENSYFNEMLKKIAKYENEVKYQAMIETKDKLRNSFL